MLWGTVGIATQAIYQQSELNAVTVGFYRLAIAFPVVALLSWKVVGREMFQVKGSIYLKMIITGFLLALYQVFYFAAIGYVGVSLATLITLCTSPVIVALVSTILLKEPLTRATIRALVCALMGTALLVGFPESVAAQGQLILGVSLALGSATGYAIVTLIGRSMAGECHSIHSTTVSLGVGAIFLFPLTTSSVFSVNYAGEIWSLLLYVGLVPTAVAYTLFFWGMRKVKASNASIITMIEPMTATILAWIIFGEQLTVPGFVGAGLLLFSVIILYRGEKDP